MEAHGFNLRNAYNNFNNDLGLILIDALNGDPEVLKRPELAALNIDNIKAALAWLGDPNTGMGMKDLVQDQGWRLMYMRKPPTPEEFLTWDWIGAQSESLWPHIRETFINFVNPDPLCPYRNLALSTAIGWGKQNPVSSNIVVDKKIEIELEDGTVKEFNSDEIISITKDGIPVKIKANDLLNMDLASIDFPQP